MISSMQLGNARWENANFNSRLQPTQLGLGTSSSDQSLWKVNYDYGTTDNNGNVKSQTITVPTLTAIVQNYTYDSLNRIKSAEETVSSSTIWKQTFDYDRFGNRRFDTTGSNTTTIPGGCSVAQCNPTIDTANNRFTTGQGYTYDSSGNLLTDAEGRTFTYDGENKQKTVANSGGTIGTYYYDGDGKRVKKVTSTETTLFVYDVSGRLVAEYMLTEDTPTSPVTSYLTNDTLGSPRVVTDASGNIVSRRDFMPYGEEISAIGGRTLVLGYQSDDIRQKFTSYERDNETDLDFAQARFYNSKLGRFTVPDEPWADQWEDEPQSWNLYSYTRNSPLRYSDPSGKWTQIECQGKEGSSCWQSDDPNDTYESLAKILGVSTTNLQNFFQNQKIEIGVVLDASGYDNWLKEGKIVSTTIFGDIITDRMINDWETRIGEHPNAGGGLPGLKPSSGSGVVRFLRWLGILPKAKPLAISQRLQIFLSRLKAAPGAKSADEALEQITRILDKVEDSYSGIPKNSNPGLKPDGRMYAPQSDFITRNVDGSISALTRGHKIDISSSGAIRISLRETGEIVFTKP